MIVETTGDARPTFDVGISISGSSADTPETITATGSVVINIPAAKPATK